MANSINLIYSQEALASIDTVLNGLKATDEQINKLAGDVAKLNSGLSAIKTPGGLQSFSDNTQQLQTQLNAAITKIAALETQIAQLGAQLAKVNSAENAATASLNSLGNAGAANAAKIEQLQIKLDKANLALRGNATEAEKAALTQRKLANDVNLANAAIDKSSNANVTAKKQWNGLGNSINQVTRELPAFTNSMQTGFLAISNNIPIVVDEIMKIVAANKVLADSGQQTKSVIKELTSAIFSWGTALSIAITALVSFGPALYDAIFGLNAYEKALLALNKELAKLTNEHYTNVEALKAHLRILNQTAKGSSENELAFANLSKVIKDGTGIQLDYDDALSKTNGTVEVYIENLKKTARFQSLIQQQTKNLNRIDEIRAIKSNQDLVEEAKTTADYVNKALSFNVRKSVADFTIERLNAERDALLANNKKIDEQLKEFAPTIDKKGGGGNTGRTPRDKNYDIIKKEAHEREVQRLNEAIRTNKAIVDDEKESLSIRLKYQQEYYADQDALTAENLKYDLYLAKATYDKKKKDLENDKNLTTQSAADRDKALVDMASEYAIEVKKIRDKALNETLKDLSDNNAQIIKLQEFDIKRVEDYYKGLKDAREADFQDHKAMMLNDKAETLKIQGLTNDEKDFMIRSTDYKIEEAARLHARKLIDIEIAKNKAIIGINDENIKKNADLDTLGGALGLDLSAQKVGVLSPEEIKKYAEAINDLNKALAENAASQKESPEMLQLKAFSQQFRDATQGLGADFAKSSGFSSLFDNLLTDADKFTDGFQSKFDIMAKAVAEGTMTMGDAIASEFQFITEVGKELNNKLNEFAEVRFQNQLDRLDREKEIAMDYAGQTADGKKAIEDQYEIKKREIEHNQAVQKKKTAMFDIALSTAQGIAATFAQLGWPAGIVGAAIVAGMGAVQLALVASKDIPAYAEGGTHNEGGLAIVNDGNGNYRETIVTPQGEVFQPEGRNVVMDLPKGSEIYTDEQWKNKMVKNMLGGHEIHLGDNYSTGLTAQEMDGVLAKHFSNITTQSVTFDANGVNSYIQKGNARTIRNTARGSGKGFLV